MTEKIPLITEENILNFYPQFGQVKRRVTKIQLHFLDDKTDVVKLYFPVFTYWGDAHELTNFYLSYRRSLRNGTFARVDLALYCTL